MNKKWYVLALVLVVILTGCGKKQDDQTSSTKNTENGTVLETYESEEIKEATLATIEVANVELPEGEGTGNVPEIYEEPDDAESVQENVTKQNDPESEMDQEHATQPSVPAVEPSTETTAPTVESTIEPTVPAVEPDKQGCGCEYAKYLAMSPAEQEAYMESFSSPMAFIEWSKAAEAEHSTHVTVIEASGEELDISQFIP